MKTHPTGIIPNTQGLLEYCPVYGTVVETHESLVDTITHKDGTIYQPLLLRHDDTMSKSFLLLYNEKATCTPYIICMNWNGTTADWKYAHYYTAEQIEPMKQKFYELCELWNCKHTHAADPWDMPEGWHYE